MMYAEWYDVSNLVVILAVEVCVDYGGSVCVCFMFVLTTTWCV